MKQFINLEESKKIQTEILAYLDKICRVHDIKYSLAYGTLLGAVRHKAHIPWDDDIDIMLYRDQYDKLMKVLAEDANYKLVKIDSSKYYLAYAKLCDKRTFLSEDGYPLIERLGVFVDIFPMDNIPDKPFIRFLYVKKMYLLDRLRYTSVLRQYYLSTNFFKSLVKFVLYTPLAICSKIMGTKKVLLITDRAMQKYNNIKTTNCGHLPNKFGYKEVFPIEWFNNFTELEFEGKMFFVIAEYDKYLKLLYGNYMQLPPENKRVSNHVFTAYWRNNL